MELDTIMSVIANLGFPIGACIWMAMQNKEANKRINDITEKTTAQIVEVSKDSKEELVEITKEYKEALIGFQNTLDNFSKQLENMKDTLYNVILHNRQEGES